MTTQGEVKWSSDKLSWIARIDQARGVIRLTVYALLSNHGGPDQAEAACALDLANEELQRLRDEIDASWAAKQKNC